ncbi:MAG: aminopeptidase [Proteobacteria bacterium]|nr:aminopeptidase [Pseudomonadota bacterium]
MLDPRLKKLAYNLINNSCKVQSGEKVLIEVFGDHYEIANQLTKEVYAAGGKPFLWLRNLAVMRNVLMDADETVMDVMAGVDGALMKQMDCYIGLRGGDNSAQLSDVPKEKMELYMTRYNQEVHGKIRVNDTKWVVLRYPSPSMSQQANMSTERFEDFYFDVCNLDYTKMGEAMKPLVALMDRTDKVRITGKGTDLTFSIKDIATIPCAGEMNIPDGEIFTAPVKDSVNGKITYNTPALYMGTTYENISFTFKDGKIVEATASDSERVNKILDTDEGARYIGEFAIGVNPYITDAMKDTLFDEKISGSIHLTPGKAYDEADNGNTSAIHWDLVMIQTPEYGGGEIYFDDVLIRKDGRFVLPELECLNPENLK